MSTTTDESNDADDDQSATPPERKRRRPYDVPSIAALALAIAAVALSAWSALRPTTAETSASPDAPVFEDSARQESRQNVCDGFATVRRGVSLNTNAGAPGGPGDAAGGLAVAANARLALLGGGLYLQSRIDPATPPELSEAAHAFADELLDIGVASIAGVPTTDSVQTQRLRSAEELSNNIARLCEAQ